MKASITPAFSVYYRFEGGKVRKLSAGVGTLGERVLSLMTLGARITGLNVYNSKPRKA